MKNNKVNLWPVAAFILMVLIGGLNAIAIRYTVLELPPFWSAALRFAPAALFFFLLAVYLKLPFPRGKALSGLVLFGALNFGGSFALIYYGLTRIQPGMAQVLLALVPLFTLFFAIAHRQETFRWRALAGALLAAGGIALVFQEQLRLNVPFTNMLALILAAGCFAEASVIVKSYPKSHPVITNAVGMAVGSTILFLISILWGEKLTLPAQANTWMALGFLVLLGTIVIFVLYLYVLKQWSASASSYQFVLLPFVSLSVSAWMGNESLSPALAIGAGLVLTGVFFGAVSLSRKPRGRRMPVPAAGKMPLQASLLEDCRGIPEPCPGS